MISLRITSVLENKISVFGSSYFYLFIKDLFSIYWKVKFCKEKKIQRGKSSVHWFTPKWPQWP